LLLLALAVLSSACGGTDAVEVDLDKKVDPASVRTAQETTGPATSTPIRVAITGLLTPSETLTGYAGLLGYLEDALGRPVELIQRGTYAELNALMEAGQLEVALVCPYPYVDGERDFGMELLAAAVHEDQTAHYSYLVVPAGSDAGGLDDLRGGAFAFSDPNSHSGWLAPAYQLALLGETQDSFFARHVFTYHHSESIRAVADGLVDGAAVDSLVYDYLATTDPGLVALTRVIARWGPYPSPPFVASPDLDPGLKESLRSSLVGMSQDAEGRAILDKLQLDGFARIDDAAYDVVRQMESTVNATGTALGR
jgi:phosphonate transport system substrate-binding protein